MVRMSDILKNLKEPGEGKDKEKKKKAKKSPPPEPKKEKVRFRSAPPEETAPPAREEPTPATSEVRISPVVMKGAGMGSEEDAKKLYEETLSLVKEVMKENINYEPIDIKKFTAQAEKLINQLSAGNDKLLMFALTRDTVEPHYIFGHTVNVCLLSIEVGLGMGFEKDRLIELGFSALLHDIGMIKYLDLTNQTRKLSPEEYDQIKKHAEEGAEALEKIKGITEKVITVSRQHHERLDGSGYPKNLKGQAIDEYARIISVVDVYEAMMHPRIYRSEYPSLETMRELLDHKHSFEYKVIKILIENIGIFPIGSYVILNTKEVARVVKVNHKIPMRPVVEIIVDTYGKKVEQMKWLNLTTEPNICIIQGIRKEDIRTK